MIGETYTESAKVSMMAVVVNMLNMAIFLSATLGVMNLLPLPALDGGRLVFLILEAIRGRHQSGQRGDGAFVGLMALMVLMVVVMYNDVTRLL